MALATLHVSLEAYNQRFRDPDFGRDLAETVAARHGLATPLVRKREGSSLVFRTDDGQWLKISPPFFGDAYDAEVAVSRLVAGRLPAAVPEIRLTGSLEDWRYLVSAEVPGVQIGEVLDQLSGADLSQIADDLGAFLAALHAVPAAGFDRAFGPWDVYLRRCLDGAEALHRSRGNDAALTERIVRFLAPRRSWLEQLGPPLLVHADLTAEHVMLTKHTGRWRVSGVLDLADAMVAPAALDLVAPVIELFRGKPEPQRRLLASSGIALDGADPSGALMAIALQHRFMHFHAWFEPELGAGMTDVTEIAAAVFPL